MAFAAAAFADETDLASINRGGRLYDRWYVDKPTEVHPLYPATGYYVSDPAKINAAATWRCKECHGYDGLGNKGADSTGNHETGIIGIDGMKGAAAADIVAAIVAPEHAFAGIFNDEQLADLANYIAYGQIDWAPYVDPVTKDPIGDPVLGKVLYETVCFGCHGLEGKLPEHVFLGKQDHKGYEMIHRVMNGMPNEGMPGLRYFGPQIAADMTAYFTTLPEE